MNIDVGSWSDLDDEASFGRSNTCLYIAYLIQFVVIAGENWMLMVSIDLVYSLTNPFISYQSYLQRYHLLVWTITFINVFFYASNSNCQGVFIEGMCWIPYSNHITDCFLRFYLGWYVHIFLHP